MGAGRDIVGVRGTESFIAGGQGHDVLIAHGAGGTSILGGPGHDAILLGTGRVGQGSTAHGQDGDGRVIGTFSGDRIFGEAGDDRLISGFGDDFVVPGRDRDLVHTGQGDDVVTIFDVCEAEPGEKLDGGPGEDILRTPVPLADLESIGIVARGFERVEVDPTLSFRSSCGSCGCEVVSEQIECCSGVGTCDFALGAEERICRCEPNFGGTDCSVPTSVPKDVPAEDCEAGDPGCTTVTNQIFVEAVLFDEDQIRAACADLGVEEPSGLDFRDGEDIAFTALVSCPGDTCDAASKKLLSGSKKTNGSSCLRDPGTRFSDVVSAIPPERDPNRSSAPPWRTRNFTMLFLIRDELGIRLVAAKRGHTLVVGDGVVSAASHLTTRGGSDAC